MAETTRVEKPITQASLIRDLVDRIETILNAAEAATRPLEMNPYRQNLFEVFVMADGAGLLIESVEPNLGADSAAKLLAERWKLRDSAQEAFRQHLPMSEQELSKVRLLWSFLRMWMEWSYAWSRWAEFHDGPRTDET